MRVEAHTTTTQEDEDEHEEALGSNPAWVETVTHTARTWALGAEATASQRRSQTGERGLCQ
jgi:hypothetical protein